MNASNSKRTGSENVVEEIFRQHGHNMQNLIGFMLRNAYLGHKTSWKEIEMLTDDIRSEVLLELLKIDGRRGIRQILTEKNLPLLRWVMGVTRLVTLSYLHRKWRKTSSEVPLLLEMPLVDEVKNATDIAEEVIENATEILSGSERKVFLLCWKHDLDVEEVALILEIQAQSVKRELRRAMERIRQWYGKNRG